jgi:serine protease Do
MNGSFDTYELIEKYCLDLMDEREKMFFEQEINSNPALAKAVHEYRTLIYTFDHTQSSRFIHDSLDQLHHHSRSQTSILVNQLKLHINKYWRTASVAASVAFVASMITFLGARSIYKRDTHAQYQTLRSEINSIKRNQNDIKEEVDKVKQAKTELPNYPSKYTGTGFAISQNGYLVTNMHVIEGYEKIFVFTEDNVGHQSIVVASDTTNDLAILKINEEGFTFGSKVPYSIKKSTPTLAQRIYSLGFPKNEIVYNEGYVSSATGFDGDTARYQLELPSGPGVSGAPIVDESGNVIGVVSGKQSQSEGITFAIKSKSLLKLVKDLPKDFSTNEIQNNELVGLSRAAQVKKIQPFVCVVKVYN